MPIRREVSAGGRFECGILRMSCSRAIERGMRKVYRGDDIPFSCAGSGLEARWIEADELWFAPTPSRTINFSFCEVTAMLVVMRAQATEEQVRAVCRKIESLGYRPHAMPG